MDPPTGVAVAEDAGDGDGEGLSDGAADGAELDVTAACPLELDALPHAANMIIVAAIAIRLASPAISIFEGTEFRMRSRSLAR
ncbi:MAG: hypothetical protein ACREOM_14100 [Candidatus Dormibacteraceae bacterium]